MLGSARRYRARQVQHAGIRGRGQHLQPGIRPDAESLGHAHELRGLLGRIERSLLKEDIVWNIEQGLAQTPQRIGEAERARGRIFKSMAEFFTRHDLLLCPTACTPPFNVNQRYVSLPCGFTEAGLPVGLQIVGRPRGEAELLSAAAALEEALGPRRPYADRAEAARRACSFLTEHANLPRERELRSCFAIARRD